MTGGLTPTELFWYGLWLAGTIVFYGRFHLQWLVSERQQRSVMPIAFWYMSSAGALMLFAYAVYQRSPIGALSTCFNIIVYARNLFHVWRGQGRLSPAGARWLNAATGAVLLVTVSLTAWIFYWQATHPEAPGNDAVIQTWFWIAVGLLGQALFGGRWAVQWVATEAKRESVVPLAFWYMSLGASLLMIASLLSRPLDEALLAVGMITTLPVYLRNIWLIHRYGATAAPTDAAPIAPDADTAAEPDA